MPPAHKVTQDPLGMQVPQGRLAQPPTQVPLEQPGPQAQQGPLAQPPTPELLDRKARLGPLVLPVHRECRAQQVLLAVPLAIAVPRDPQAELVCKATLDPQAKQDPQGHVA